MKHIDEHTLMRFALNPAEFGAQRHDLERHLEECHGCRALAIEMSEFYKNAGEILLSLESEVEEEKALIVPHSSGMAIRHRNDAVHKPLHTIDRFRGFFGRRPVVALTGMTVIIGVAALAVQFAVTTFYLHPQPSYFSANEKASLLEVFGADQRQLFTLPVENITAIVAAEGRRRVSMSLIDDVRGSGEKVLVTGLPMVDDAGHRLNVLRIFDGSKRCLLEKELGSPVTFRRESYTAYFGISGMISEPVREGRGRELFVGAADARSPFCLYRLDHTGNILGEFWHFGHVGGLYGVDLQRDGRKQLVMCGMNDVDDENGGSFPAILVVDPNKLTGRTESTASRGFGFPANEGELYYIKVERLKIEKRMGVKALFSSMRLDQDSSLTFVYEDGRVPYLPSFFLNFGFDMKLRAIWTDDGTRHTIFKNDRAAVDAGIAELRSGIRYWDGVRWTAQKTSILHRN